VREGNTFYAYDTDADIAGIKLKLVSTLIKTVSFELNVRW
jgi:hypothetical protein